jgi:heavy metal translocating P-type ATPase
MLKKIFEFCSSLPATIIGGISLAVSLGLWLGDINVLIDPAWIAVALCGFPLLYLAIRRIIFNKGVLKISSALLISIAMIAAIFIGELFAAGQVAFIMAIGGILEDKTIERAKKGIKELISLVPEQGRIIINGAEKMIPIEQVKKDDVLRVMPGEAIPIDGEILSGNTTVDQSIITGESLPIDKAIGDDVYCGTINRFGSIDIRATKIGEDSSLHKLIRLVQEAENNKAPTQLIVDKWAAWLVPLSLLIAITTYLITGNIITAVTIMIVFCPCALALATPTSIMAAIGQATKHGVIIKSGEALEQMGKVDIIAFDKTGTLTHGNLVVSDVVTLDDNMSDSELLSLTASAESYSEHPLGKAIVAYAREEKVTIQEAANFVMIPGKGISVDIDEKAVLCGNAIYLQENNIDLDKKMDETLEGLRKQGKATILVSYDGKCKGIIALSDTLRDTAKAMVEELKETNTDTVLLTGDNRQTADYFAKQVDIKSIYSELLPADKVEQIQALQMDGRKVCMIGDGVNDAPALKTANVGVAMGSMGSDIAIEAADIALMGDDIAKIPYLKRLSNGTVKLIFFNITISIIFNVVAIVLSILGVLNPITGALAHNIGAVAVVLNAALLYDRKYI